MIITSYLYFSCLIFSFSGHAVAEPELEHIAPFPNVKFIENIYVRNEVLEKTLLGTEKIGGYCSLSSVENNRHTIAESSGGTLFTGEGWCLYKPPY
jgi:hypothetical protein